MIFLKLFCVKFSTEPKITLIAIKKNNKKNGWLIEKIINKKGGIFCKTRNNIKIGFDIWLTNGGIQLWSGGQPNLSIKINKIIRLKKDIDMVEGEVSMINNLNNKITDVALWITK